LTRIRIGDSYRKAERRIPQRLRLQAAKALSTFMETPDRPHPPLFEGDILGPSDAFRRKLDFYTHTKEPRSPECMAARGTVTARIYCWPWRILSRLILSGGCNHAARPSHMGVLAQFSPLRPSEARKSAAETSFIAVISLEISAKNSQARRSRPARRAITGEQHDQSKRALPK
jgi:hypothetical protein